ncbi:MAG: hypothetical protein U9R53_10065 [Chloroflexota bacterium]|nr:hypothetical protein [Chloroflexota bacterium]
MSDLRKYSQVTQKRLVIGLLVLVFTLGLGLIYFFFGLYAALLGLFSLLGVLFLILLIWLILRLMERLAK